MACASKSEPKYFSTLKNIYTFDKQNSSADSWLGETQGCDFPHERTVPCPKGSCFLILKILKRPYLKIYKIKLAPVQYPLYLGLFCVVFLYWDPSPSLNTSIFLFPFSSLFVRVLGAEPGRHSATEWLAGWFSGRQPAQQSSVQNLNVVKPHWVPCWLLLLHLPNPFIYPLLEKNKDDKTMGGRRRSDSYRCGLL